MMYKDWKMWPSEIIVECYLEACIERYNQQPEFIANLLKARAAISHDALFIIEPDKNAVVAVCAMVFANYFDYGLQRKVESALEENLFGGNTAFLTEEYVKAAI